MRRALVGMRPDRFEDIIALVALYRPGPMANIPTYCARKLGEEEVEYAPSQDRADPGGRPTASSSTRSRCSRSPRSSPATRWPRPTCCAAPWARRSGPRWTRSAAASSTGAIERGIDKAQAEHDFRCLRQVRRLRLQQVARGALRADHLPDRLSEGELPGRVPRRVDDARHAATPTSSPSSAARRSASASRSWRRRSTGRAAISTSRDGRIFYSLGRHQGRRRAGGRAHRRGPRQQAVPRPRRFRPSASIRASINKRALESLVAAGAFDELEPDRARVHCRRRPRSSASRRAPRTTRLPARATCSAAATTASRCSCRRSSPGCPPNGCSASTTRSASTSRPIRSTSIKRVLQKMRVQSWAEFRRIGAARGDRRAPGRHGDRRGRSAGPGPATDGASSSSPIRPAPMKACSSRKA